MPHREGSKVDFTKEEIAHFIWEDNKDVWGNIVKDVYHLIGKYYICHDDGLKYRFFGVVWAEDDFYYGFSPCGYGHMALSSCCGSIDMFGKVIDE